MITDVIVCNDCGVTYMGSHKCENPRPQQLDQMRYYQKRRDYLFKKNAGRWDGSDNDAADPEQQEPREAYE